MPVFVSYDQAERMVSALLDRAARWEPDCVVGIMRGGLIPATMAASVLALPLFLLSATRDNKVTWVGPTPKERRLLLIDDCCATGATMRLASTRLVAAGYECLTLTIAHDPETTGFIPDLSHPMTSLFRFPWERGEATPAGRALRASGAPADRRTEAPFVGLDLDGIFLPDIPRPDYAADLAKALARRHALEPFLRRPAFSADRAVVITARLAEDRADTEAWLARCGHAGLPLEFRPPDVSDTPAEVARYKAEAATRWGCTHFMESEAEQAIRIAGLAPHLIVQWWSPDEAKSWIIGAAVSP